MKVRDLSESNSSAFSRRNFLRIVVISGTAGLTLTGIHSKLIDQKTITITRRLMGTIVNLTVISDSVSLGQRAVGACLDRMEDLEQVLSRYRPESQLSMLNKQGYLDDAHPALIDLLSSSAEISRLSGGAFDITVAPLYGATVLSPAANRSSPDLAAAMDLVDYRQIMLEGNQVRLEKPGMAISLDGIAKGYIVDQGISTISELGFDNALVEAGGDLVASGERGSDDTWQVGIQSPRDETADLLAKLELTQRAVGTSGDYLQAFTDDLSRHHIIDPRTGVSSPELASATVVARTGAMADGWATALMVMGTSDGLTLVESLPDLEAYLVTKDLREFRSSGFTMAA